jgi:adenine C2-methylase RlmN of 23S rRNA A2503 and tRNA A37
MNWQFSYTTKMGLKGNLSTAHVVEQLVIATRMCNQELGLGVVTNVMFMSMGESPSRILIIRLQMWRL